VLTIEGLHKRFGKREVLRGLDLQVRPGEVYGLLGSNGAGKSTALKILCGLVHADAGRVRIGEHRLEQAPLRALAQVGAQIDQPAFHGHLSGRENLRLLAGLTRIGEERVEAVLDEVGLRARAGDRFAVYSTGMRQRLGLAAAMLGEPPLLLIDEPTTGLDPEGRRDLVELIRGLQQRHGCSVLFSSHLFEEIVALCDRCGILHEGRLHHDAAPGDAESLRELYFSLGGSST